MRLFFSIIRFSFATFSISFKLSFYDLQGVKLNRTVSRKQLDLLFLLTVYIIVKLFVKIIQEVMLQFGCPFKLLSLGRDSGSFLWKNIGPEDVEFSNVLVQMP